MNVGFLIATVGRCARLALVGVPLQSSAQGESANSVGNPSLQLCLSLVKERKQEGTEILYELFSCQTLSFLLPVCSLRGSDTINPCPPQQHSLCSGGSGGREALCGTNQDLCGHRAPRPSPLYSLFLDGPILF